MSNNLEKIEIGIALHNPIGLTELGQRIDEIAKEKGISRLGAATRIAALFDASWAQPQAISEYDRHTMQLIEAAAVTRGMSAAELTERIKAYTESRLISIGELARSVGKSGLFPWEA